jgi:ATP adenylyltransferase
MRHLWAPWRMLYIQQSETVSSCLFCDVASARDDERNHVVHRGSRSLVMLNLYPYNSGHLMVIPYQHVGTLPEVEPAAGADVFRVTQLAVRALQEAMSPHGFNVGVNQGKVAGAGIADHIHLHVVPRWNGDTNFMPVVGEVKVLPESLEDTAKRLRPLFDRYGRET